MTTGVCLVYCDDTKANHGCDSNQTCTEFHVGSGDSSPTVHVCVPVVPDGSNIPPDDTGYRPPPTGDADVTFDVISPDHMM
jgi:hypothetical protein